MRVVIVSPVFPPEPVVSSRTSAQLAETLAAHGHHVTVITAFPSRPAGRLFPGYSRRLFRREKSVKGFAVVRCFGLLSHDSRMLSRFGENLSFGITSGLALLFMPRPDVIYSVTWPIFASGILTLVAALRGIPVVSSVQDVYPESMISQDRIPPGGLVARCLRAADRWFVRRNQGVIVISESFLDIYRRDRRVAAERLFHIPNWVDEKAVIPDEVAGNRFRKSLALPSDACLVVYGGNVGTAAGVETLVEAFRLLDCPNLYLLVAGEGSKLAACQAIARQLPKSQVLFHHPWSSVETSTVLSAADLLLLPTRGRQSLASMPSKLLFYMLSARPILALALPESDLACLIQRSGCGWVVEPDRPDLLAAKLLDVLTASREEWQRRGRAGRQFALQNLTADVCLPRVVDVITACSSSV